MTDGRATSNRVTPKQRTALVLIYERETLGNNQPRELNAEVVGLETWADGYTAFVNVQTAEALERRGLLTIEPIPGEGAICGLTDTGRLLARAAR